jgi:hypothetical protein
MHEISGLDDELELHADGTSDEDFYLADGTLLDDAAAERHGTMMIDRARAEAGIDLAGS